MKRGIVTSSKEIVSINKGFSLRGGLTEVDMNYMALYWDKIVIPKEIFMHVRVPDEDLFIDCGILERPDPDITDGFHSEDFSKFYLKTQNDIIDTLRKNDSSMDWRIHQFGNEVSLMGDVRSESLRIEISNLLPVPLPEVNLQEILEFKERRSSELEALHAYSDALYFEVINSGDPDLTKARVVSKLKEAISDLNRLNSETWKSPIKFNLQISNEVDIAKIKSLYATIASAAMTDHPTESLILGGIFTFLEGFVSLKVGRQRVRAGGGSELIYLSNAKKEKMI
ncbi:DUF6236 family protein [Providencia rettgeri]|uniref:DUF6236 family protein n=1 Tax=Providencia rettgeri TaxID=587 RepID=UPI00235FCCAA|nr:DUF6236 family protein [Providencia rettgeri]